MTIRPPISTETEAAAAEAKRRANGQARMDAIRELWKIQEAQSKTSKPPPSPPLTPSQKEIRALASEYTGDEDPSALPLPPKTTSREQELEKQIAARDMADSVLMKRANDALEAAAETRVKEIAATWKKLVAKTIRTAIELYMLECRARAILAEELCGQDATGLVGRRYIGFHMILGGSADVDPLREIVALAIADGVISKSEIEKITKEIANEF